MHFLRRRLLFELKTLHFGSSAYLRTAAARCNAVARWAAQLLGEHARKAKRVDDHYCGTAQGELGPVSTRLQAFEPVKGLVFGAWGEVSPDVAALLKALTAAGAERHWCSMTAPAPSQARGSLAWLLRRRWAMTAVRENARLLLSRLDQVGSGAHRAATRRIAAEGTAARARRASCWQCRGPAYRSGPLGH